jgi:uncharacterized protein (DUF2141 family)
MKKTKKVLLVALMLLGTMMCFAQETANSVIVKVTGIEEMKGEISIGLFSDEENYPNGDVFAGTFVKADNETITYTFENIPEGVFAIAIYHDENSNKKHDKNFLGIPKEGYAFSNNVFGTFGPPKFEKTKFEVKEDIQLEIKLKY